MSDATKTMDSAGRRSASCWIYEVSLAVLGAQHRAYTYSTECPENRLIRTRLSGDDPYWWILAGGIHVPGFGATKPGEENSST